MDVKKIGIWGGAFVGSFLVVLLLIFFLFPYLNPDKAEKAAQKKEPVPQETSFDPSRYSLQTVDSLNQRVASLHIIIDSLQKTDSLKQQLIDSLKQGFESRTLAETERPSSMYEDDPQTIPAIEEATKPLLSLDEEALAPIVDLLEEHQLISLYREGSGRQREKLLRTLKPEKAAKILKKVM